MGRSYSLDLRQRVASFVAVGHSRRAAARQFGAATVVRFGCGDVPVWPGDGVVGDQEGVVIVPAHLVDEVADEAVEIAAFEDFLTEDVMKGRSILGLYPATEERTKPILPPGAKPIAAEDNSRGPVAAPLRARRRGGGVTGCRGPADAAAPR
jgi:hypothetical protein